MVVTLGKARFVVALLTGAVLGVTSAMAVGDYGPDTCMDGFVWREAIPSDHVCVTPDVREAARRDNAAAASRVQPGGGPYGPDTCRSGFVWREAHGPADHVCVIPAVRDRARADNARAPQLKKYPFCRAYANDALVTASAAVSFGCNFAGPRWSSTAEQHFQWCLATHSNTVAREQAARGTELTMCRQAQ